VLVFASSDKGGTGRSVTSCNIAFHLAQQLDVAYLDFDFGSPTAGAIFEIAKVERGVEAGGLHSYVRGRTADPRRFDVWQHTSRAELRASNARVGRLVMFPGDQGGAEFAGAPNKIKRCVELFSRLAREFDVCVVDLSAGRSTALELALAATADPVLRGVTARWLIFHRWTRQHIIAAHGLVYGEHGLLKIGAGVGHGSEDLIEATRFVRTAVPDINAHNANQTSAQATWLRTCDEELRKLALTNQLGRSRTLGSTPVEPVLQWREQVISDADVSREIANAATVQAFRDLADKLIDNAEWEGL
jgi:hypothetical protein